MLFNCKQSNNAGWGTERVPSASFAIFSVDGVLAAASFLHSQPLFPCSEASLLTSSDYWSYSEIDGCLCVKKQITF